MKKFLIIFSVCCLLVACNNAPKENEQEEEKNFYPFALNSNNTQLDEGNVQEENIITNQMPVISSDTKLSKADGESSLWLILRDTNPLKTDEINEKFLEASKTGDLETIKKIFEDNDTKILEWSILMDSLSFASAKGYTEIVKFLLESGEYNFFPYMPDEALAEAAINGHKEIVKLFLAEYQKPRPPQKSECPGAEEKPYTPPSIGEIFGEIIFQEIRNGKANAKRVKALASQGADLNWKFQVDAVGDCGAEEPSSALIEAITRNDITIAKLLIDLGADVDILVQSDFGDGGISWMTPLKAAVSLEDVPPVKPDDVKKMIDLLVSKGSKDLFGAIHSPKILKGMIKRGAKLESTVEYGYTPLIEAVREDAADSVKVLLDAGAKVNAKDDIGQTALMYASGVYDHLSYACAGGHCVDIVKILLAFKADVNVKDNYQGNTALISAAKNGNAEIAKLLIEAGADVNLANNDGNTPLKYAEENGHTEIVELLKAHGAK